MGKCKYQNRWLDKKDSTGHKISVWAEKQSEQEIFCKVCQCSISVIKGFHSIRQHYETDKHQNNFAREIDADQLRISNIDDNTNATIRLYSVKDSAFTAELIWCLKMVSGDVPANFSQDIASVFKAMFPSDNAVPEKFSLNPTKVRYLMSDALGPYFRGKLLKDVGSAYFTLMFDETLNNANTKELQTAIRFWSDERNEVVSHHLETFYMGHATAEHLKNNIMMALNNADLQLSKLLMVGSDGPAVNQKLFSLLNEEVKSIRGKGLVDIGFCNIHMIHNSFQKGLEKLGSDASELIIDVYRYFKDWPSRKEDFIECQNKKGLENKMFIKHVSSRWLTIEPAATRLLEQWDAIIEYFLTFIPLSQKTLMKTKSYKRIVNLLEKKTMKAELKFVCISSTLFTKFTGLYQKQEPLIHMLHDHVKDLVVSLMCRSCTQEAVKKFKKSPSEEVFTSENLLPLKDMSLGEELENLTANLSSSEKEKFNLQIRNHYVAAGKYILLKKVLFSKLFKCFSCIQPDKMKLAGSQKKFRMLAALLHVPYEEETLMDEWRLVQLEDMKSSSRIEHFWSQVFPIKNTDGSLKYANVARIIKAVLTLSHGNAEIERGFSKSARIMTEDRASMSIRTLNARLNIADGLKRYDNKPHLVPINDELLNLARNAYKSYEEYLQKEKQKAEEEEKIKLQEQAAQIIEEQKKEALAQSKETIKALEAKLENVKECEKIQNSAVKQLLEEANLKLKTAIQKNNISGVQVAQSILEGAMKSNVQCDKKRKAIDVLEQEIHKKKDHVITKFFPTKIAKK